MIKVGSLDKLREGVNNHGHERSYGISLNKLPGTKQYY
jgi:hypothetical protein